MKNLFLSFIVCFLSITSLLTGADIKKFDIKDFSGVNVGWGMHVKISQSSNFSVEIKAEERDFQYLKVEKEDNTLKIYIDKKNYRFKDDVDINITMPEISSLSLHGGAEGLLKMENPNTPLSADLSGGAQLKGELKCSDIELNLSGGSQVTLNGNAGNLSADGSGGSIFRLKDLLVKDVDAELSGGSMVYVKMDGELNVDASGGSQVKYYGKATIGKMDFSGGAGISQGD